MFARRQFFAVLLFLALSIAALYPHTAAAQDRQGQPITSLVRVREAVVHIESVGAAWQYDETEPSVEVGAGSGFIIDPAGIVVTNAHVVNGGNLFKVYLFGESEPRNAVLLGVSECDDLAVLDIRGSGFPYLLWQETPLASSQVVYAAGYPGGEYTETRGRVQNTGRNGDSDWASVDHVVRHTAELHPGNSGGPLLNRLGARPVSTLRSTTKRVRSLPSTRMSQSHWWNSWPKARMWIRSASTASRLTRTMTGSASGWWQ